MPKVTILRRDRTGALPGAEEAPETAEVTFVTEMLGHRSVTLPIDLYRPATEEELAANPRYRMVPVDAAAEHTERESIEEALKREAAGPPTSFDVP